MTHTNLVQSVFLAGLRLLEPEQIARPEPIGRIEEVRVVESSGLAHSRQIPGLWWTHNDSGHTPHLFPMAADGASRGAPVKIGGARNVDWEDLAADDHGQLWISDLGNNRNLRRDLTVYVIDEPRPDPDGTFPAEVPVKRSFRVRYPDQEAFPPEQRNFDSEGIFVRGTTLYVLTKHRSDPHTKLYKLETGLIPPGEDHERELTLVQTFENIGMVTGSALHPDGKRLAVLTYTGVWLFETDGETEELLGGRVAVLPAAFRAWGQVEGIDWLDGETLLISNEQSDLFRIRVDQLGPPPVFEPASGE